MPAPAFGPADVGGVVSLRVRTPGGPADVVGTVLAIAADSLTLRRRDGRVEEVALASVVMGRRVPPTPAQRIGARDLQLLVSRGWRPLEQEVLGDWLLRASGGFTRRANSALIAGAPALPAQAALAAVRSWYGERSLPPTVLVPAQQVQPDVLQHLDADGWQPAGAAQVMTAELGHVLRAAPDAGVDVRLDDAPDDDWLALYRRDAGPLPPVARAILTNHPAAVFVSVRDAGTCVAIARATVDDRWAGLYAVEVAVSQRRRGLGVAVSAAALRWAVARGARHVHLQTALDNTAAVAMYERLGFSVHHGYDYRVGNVDA